MPTMLDTCILLDVFEPLSAWYEWSARTLMDVSNAGPLIINAVVYAELAAQFNNIEELEALLSPQFIEYHSIPREAAFLAGKCFLEYRRRGGTRTSPLPDFFIGAHAAVEGLPLVTRDVRRYHEYFPRLKLICP